MLLHLNSLGNNKDTCGSMLAIRNLLQSSSIMTLWWWRRHGGVEESKQPSQFAPVAQPGPD